jgi:hypothetical protein
MPNLDSIKSPKFEFLDNLNILLATLLNLMSKHPIMKKGKSVERIMGAFDGP